MRNTIRLGFSAIIGIQPLLWLPCIPGLPIITAIFFAAFCLGLIPRLFARYVAFGLLCFCWALFNARESLAPFEQWIAKPVTVDAVITSTDGKQNHDWEMASVEGRLIFPPVGVKSRGSYLPGSVCAGQRWRMKLQLRPVHGQLNDGGFDSQRYALAQHQPLSARIISAEPVTQQCSLRAQWMAAVQFASQSLPYQGVIMALAFGDRSGVSDEQKNLLRQSGTAHLMAISGMHISLAAMVGWLIARVIQLSFPAHRIHFRMPLLASVIAAGVYTWLAGGNPPAARALIGVVIWLFLRLQGRCWSGWEVWLCCISGILIYDPLTVLSDSFWLSVLAVASLIFWYQWMPLPGFVAEAKGLYRYLLSLLHLQIGIMLLLMPLQIFIFHGVSLSALIANLLAVPLITFAVVPLLLAGLVLTTIPWLGEHLWWGVDRLLALLFTSLSLLPDGWREVDKRFQLLSLSGWIAVIIHRLSLWRSSSLSVLALLISLVASTIRTEKKDGAWQITMLDVGHGLAIAFIRQGKVLLYDTGNAWPAGDAAQQVIIPWLRWHNLTPEQVVISHEHLDHRGGLNSLQSEWPTLKILSPLRWAGHHPCFQGQMWQWRGLQFTALWPPTQPVMTGNNGSCVVMVSDGHFRILLTGDMEAEAELAMLKGRWGILHADIIQVPHHGSRTSSSAPLLRAVSASAALASTSRYNAWHLPSGKVVQRYKSQGYKWYSTAQSGQLTIDINSDKWQINSFREQISPRWYHQWFGVSQDNG
ncbi:ComEC family protein [Buttiauxella sp. WJP83]|uniref:ComEC family protein n=1 Tax=Buttiauxella sp. WJP83 TaxID=2986951 RepID=UPI0022DE033E|nr:ComEC family protein [Buttiauxella sp. WJP83]WBM69392.1 ComEC family protein [Buttiauxella sp. WJP83]